jgi:hypothetical protein
MKEAFQGPINTINFAFEEAIRLKELDRKRHHKAVSSWIRVSKLATQNQMNASLAALDPPHPNRPKASPRAFILCLLTLLGRRVGFRAAPMPVAARVSKSIAIRNKANIAS